VAIYAIGDLHLSQNQSKPMDIFGPQWVDHPERLEKNWLSLVKESDLVIVAGDISWAMHLPEALDDLNWLDKMPGSKILIRGNHDYWWSSVGKVRAVLPSSISVLQNDSLNWSDWSICGTRGWICPGDEGFDNEYDQRIYLREIKRLEMSLKNAAENGSGKIIVALHFPPFNRKNQPNAFTEMLESYGVKKCVFGHIHDSGRDDIFQGLRNNVEYYFVAADGIDFCPKLLVQ